MLTYEMRYNASIEIRSCAAPKMDVYSDRNHIRMLAIGLLDAGSTKKEVALNFGLNVSTIRR